MEESELHELVSKIGGQKCQDIALRFLGCTDAELEDLEEGLRSNVQRVKFKLFLAWYHSHPEGNPRLVSSFPSRTK